jgi:hypothetical protein
MADDIIGNFCSFRFFFIKDESSKYIGAVLDMCHDLHWYVVPKSRKLGYLTDALKKSILPYLFCNERVVQKITIKKNAIGERNYLNSKSVALKLGFKATNEEETEFELKQTDYNWDINNLKEINSEINSERYEQLRKRVFYAYKILCQISDELQMSVNDELDLKVVANKVRDYTWKIEDLEWKLKNK